MFYKIGLLLLAILLTTSIVRCQKPRNNNETINKMSPISHKEQEDWKDLDINKTLFCDFPEECEKYDNGTFWYQRKFEDSVFKHRVKLALNFLNNYPESNHYAEALKIFLSPLFEPWFLKDIDDEETKSLLEQKPIIKKGDKADFYKQLRSMPFDIEARNQWLKKGDSLVNKFLESNALDIEKAQVEVGLLGRYLRQAKELFEFQYLNKDKNESEFWFLYDKYFWKTFISRLDELIYKYPKYSRWPILIDQFISLITENYLSPELGVPYWKHFRDITNKSELFEKYPVIAEIHNKANDNLRTVEELNKTDKNAPLQMEFTSIDGEKINLKNYRGKVVLIDFWSIRCAPCIQEMPHIRAMYDKYKDQGFEVIGISAEGDASKQRVLDIIKKQGANWPQLLDKGDNITVSYHSLHAISSWPTAWLLDKNGIIVDKNARGDRLEPLIIKYLTDE